MVKFKNKKKGFTLVEVIIVLAIIAIIAAIAIPNLTKVRTESKIKADTQSAETIRRTLITLITDDTIKVDSDYTITFDDSDNDGIIDTLTPSSALNITEGRNIEYVTEYFEGIKMPQSDGATHFEAQIESTTGNVIVIVEGAGITVE